MILLVLKKKRMQSKRSNYEFYYLFFKSQENGKSYKTCISPEFRNWSWWKDINEGDVIKVNDEMIHNNLVDADAVPQKI